MARGTLSLEPMKSKVTTVSPSSYTADSWFYEEPEGLLVVVQHSDEDGGWLGTSMHRITWNQVRRSLARRDAGVSDTGKDVQEG